LDKSIFLFYSEHIITIQSRKRYLGFGKLSGAFIQSPYTFILRAADRKSLPKQPISTGKGRETGSRRLEISTQTAAFAGKGRETGSRRLENSTQTAAFDRKR